MFLRLCWSAWDPGIHSSDLGHLLGPRSYMARCPAFQSALAHPTKHLLLPSRSLRVTMDSCNWSTCQSPICTWEYRPAPSSLPTCAWGCPCTVQQPRVHNGASLAYMRLGTPMYLATTQGVEMIQMITHSRHQERTSRPCLHAPRMLMLLAKIEAGR
eukprot:1152170-Pelagomonas_calceolata.AAC.13